jgi:hypothetical protein
MLSSGLPARLQRYQPFLTVLAAAALLVARAPDAFTMPQFWAEDATEFFVTARQHGLASVPMPYSGYLHLGPRLVAWAASLLPPLYAPAAYLAAAVGATLWTVALIAGERCTLPFRSLAALGTIWVPHTGEVFANLTNVQWLLPLGVLATCLSQPTASAAGTVLERLYLLLFAFSGPFSIILLPVIAGRLHASRTDRIEWRRWLANGAICLAGAIAQAVLILRTGNLLPVLGPSGPALPAFILFDRLFASAIPWPDPVVQMQGGILMIACCAAALAWPGPKLQRLAIAWVMLAVIAAVLWRFRSAMPMMDGRTNGDRYFYISHVMVTWLLLGLLGAGGRFRWVGRAVAATGLGLVATAAAAAIPRPPQADYQWEKQARQIGTGQDMVLHVAPGWHLPIAGIHNR